MAVLMELSRIFIREMTDMQIIELSEVDGDRTFPIVIGLPEAFAIERRLKGIEIPRPQTHDLLGAVIKQMGGTLKRIVINDLAEGTFFARLVIQQDGQEIEIDSRPSDAIALGVAEDAPIYVAEHVLEQTQHDKAVEDADDEEDEDEEDEDDDGGEADDDDDDDEHWK
ncbi:MAG TPA: bifunctional nuclease family protein [Phycisphaerales bacterium]|nr:bifunctional nuclease family protein [Phycisphaerales bacterium]